MIHVGVLAGSWGRRRHRNEDTNRRVRHAETTPWVSEAVGRRGRCSVDVACSVTRGRCSRQTARPLHTGESARATPGVYTGASQDTPCDGPCPSCSPVGIPPCSRRFGTRLHTPLGPTRPDARPRAVRTVPSPACTSAAPRSASQPRTTSTAFPDSRPATAPTAAAKGETPTCHCILSPQRGRRPPRTATRSASRAAAPSRGGPPAARPASPGA
jgi:hypothetical protein